MLFVGRWAPVVVFLAGAGLLVWLGQGLWFLTDEWDFLLYRRDLSVANVLRPHNDHWLSGPVLIFRGLFEIGGLTSYWPYYLTGVALHAGATAVAWAVLRRLGVPPVPAGMAALALLLMGGAWEQIFNAFQLSWTAPVLLFGVALLQLERGEEEPSRRDEAVAAACLLLAMPFGGVAVALLAGVGAALVVRRAWWRALVVTGPAALAWVAWRLTWGASPPLESDALAQVPAYLAYGVAAAVAAVGSVPVVAGAVLAVLLAAGVLVSAARRRLPLAGVAAGFALVAFYASAGIARLAANGVEQAGASRYLWLGATLAVVLAAAAARPLWSLRGPTAVASLLLAIAVVANSLVLLGQHRAVVERKGSSARVILAGSRLVAEGTRFVPFAQVDPVWAPSVTGDQLLGLERAGVDLAYAGPLPQGEAAVDEAADRLQLAFHGVTAPFGEPTADAVLVRADGEVARTARGCLRFVQAVGSSIELRSGAGLLRFTAIAGGGFLHLRRTTGYPPVAPVIGAAIAPGQTRALELAVPATAATTGRLSVGFPTAMTVEVCARTLVDARLP